MYKVAIIGPESTGKTSLAKFLAARYSGLYIPEYAREYVEALAPTYAYTQQDVIRIAQHQIEELSSLDCPLAFFDTDLIITKVWLQHKYGQCPDFINEALQRYPIDAYLLCYPAGLGVIGAWIALFIDQTTRFVASTIRFAGGKWKTIKLG